MEEPIEETKENLYTQINAKYDTYLPLISKFDVISTRFKSNTYLELYRYKLQQELSNQSIYGVNAPMNSDTNIHKYLFVLEMNNTINKIMGIGLIKNNLAKNQQIQIYNDNKFNNYIYKSPFHIQLVNPCIIDNYTKSSLSKNKVKQIYCDNIDDEFIDFFEYIIIPKCFFGKGHIKRGGGFTRFPIKYLQPEVMQMFVKLFVYHNPNNFNTIIIQKIL